MSPASGLQVRNPPTFYSSLNPDTVTTDPTQARYVKVTTVNRSVVPTFLRAVGATSTNTTNASAVAGTTYVACNVQPLMICNPWEQDADPSFIHHFNSPGQTLKLSQEGGNNLGPGNFNLVDPPGQSNSTANQIRNLLSKTSSNVCYVNTISPRTGQVTQKVLDGINVRFNIYPNGNTTGLDETPAPNVIKGEVNSNPQRRARSVGRRLGWS
jgi:hypothetical protein